MTIAGCQYPSGGFSGAPGQLPHVAATFAALHALAVIGTPEAYSIVNLVGLRKFLGQMKLSSGAFTMHEDGEHDLRAIYCALASADLCNLLDDELSASVGEYVGDCQSFEGGLGAQPGCEAHAGYTYCGTAALCILGQLNSIDSSALASFGKSLQCKQAGGFRGRTLKLVDGCYSFWAGSLSLLLNTALCDPKALAKYILRCCQQEGKGGLRDKPGKHPDYYHTCYCLSGLAVAQQLGSDVIEMPTIDPVHNLVSGKAERMRSFYAKL